MSGCLVALFFSLCDPPIRVGTHVREIGGERRRGIVRGYFCSPRRGKTGGNGTLMIVWDGGCEFGEQVHQEAVEVVEAEVGPNGESHG